MTDYNPYPTVNFDDAKPVCGHKFDRFSFCVRKPGHDPILHDDPKTVTDDMADRAEQAYYKFDLGDAQYRMTTAEIERAAWKYALTEALKEE